MGFDIHATRLVLLAKRQGIDFARTVTLGRQWLAVEPQSLQALFQEMKVELDAERRQVIEAALPYADGLLRALGARSVTSLDASAYEGASTVHDLNEELPAELVGRFTLVVDCGTLEHVFNFPIAMRNCMRLLEVGGHLLLATPANNFMGHGFYQFSPELFYRVLSPENGFLIQKMYVCEAHRLAVWYELPDPAFLGRRVELVNAVPTYLLIAARKVSDVAPLTKAPQQSDYEQGHWHEAPNGLDLAAAGGPIRALAREVTPRWLQRLKSRAKALRSPFRAPYFKRVDPHTLDGLKRE